MTVSETLVRDILLLEVKRESELAALKEEVVSTLQSLKPINLIKSTIAEVTQSPEIRGGIGKAAFGMVTGLLLKKLVFGSSEGMLKKSAGAIFQTLAANITTRNSDKIVEKSSSFFQIAKAFLTPRKKEITDVDIPQSQNGSAQNN